MVWDGERYTPPLTGQDLRGKNYCKIFDECGVRLAQYFAEICGEKGKFSPKDLARLQNAIGLPLKTTCEFLEYLELLPCGTWDKLDYLGIRDALKNANAKDVVNG